MGGAWIVWGNSFSGKTTFVFQRAQYLAGFGKVLFNSCEEGDNPALQNAG
ncbi:hypothetical protein Barb6_01727 [Bacteroidales bacterium Barb6]|nr:hypothetical protein Barb6_01727 [Bacteroidales bacterium Barb6]